MEPRIQYTKTEDGVNIAYYTLGDGPVVIQLPDLPWSHIQWEWHNRPTQRAIAEGIAERGTCVRYDCRGSGSSTRDVTDFSLDAHILDLEAVVDRLGLESSVLISNVNSGPVAIAYAVRSPERVSNLVLWNTYASHFEALATPEGQAFLALRRQDWTIYTEAATQIQAGWSGQSARDLAAFFRASTTEEVALSAQRALSKFNVTDLLLQVKTRTLVVHTGFTWPSVDSSRSLAAGIPGARLFVTENVRGSVVAIGEFLGVPPEEPLLNTDADLLSGTAIIFFLDIADSTALTTKLGDAAYREKERDLDASLRAAITGAAGTPIEGKVLGDGVMAVFTSARSAIEAAQRCRDLGNEAGLPLHIGVHAGDVVREGSNVHGGAVQVASRVQSAAAPGEILVSATVRDIARTSAGVEFEDRGEHALKGIAEPQRLFAVREQDSA